MIGFLIARLMEASTWRGMFMFLTAAGVSISPEQSNAIMSVGLASVGAIGVFTKDKD